MRRTRTVPTTERCAECRGCGELLVCGPLVGGEAYIVCSCCHGTGQIARSPK